MNQFIAFIALCSAFVLSGCNTVRGMGEDIQKAGTAIERSAK